MRSFMGTSWNLLPPRGMAPRRPWSGADCGWGLDEDARNAWRRRLVVNPKALAQADAGGARARHAPPEAELEGASSSPPRQAATLRIGANATFLATKSAGSTYAPAPQETQSAQCPRSCSGHCNGAPPPFLQSSAGMKTEMAAVAPNVALGKGEKARDLRTTAQTIVAKATARVSFPICPATSAIVPVRAVRICSPSGSYEEAVSALIQLSEYGRGFTFPAAADSASFRVDSTLRSRPKLKQSLN